MILLTYFDILVCGCEVGGLTGLFLFPLPILPFPLVPGPSHHAQSPVSEDSSLLAFQHAAPDRHQAAGTLVRLQMARRLPHRYPQRPHNIRGVGSRSELSRLPRVGTAGGQLDIFNKQKAPRRSRRST